MELLQRLRQERSTIIFADTWQKALYNLEEYEQKDEEEVFHIPPVEQNVWQEGRLLFVNHPEKDSHFYIIVQLTEPVDEDKIMSAGGVQQTPKLPWLH
jgi:hypothetical protein